MNQDQQIVSWLAVFGIVIAIMIVYRAQLSAIIFGAPSSGFAGPSTVVPSPGNPQGIGVIQPTPPPPGQTGTFGVDQNGDLYKKVGGVWVPWGTTAPGNQPLGPASFNPSGLSGVTV